MNVAGLLRDLFDRVATDVHGAVEGLDLDALTHRVDGTANSISWLAWPLPRVQDDHVAEVAGTEQVWTADGGAQRFGLPFDDGAIGYGLGSEEAGAVGAGADLLLGAHDPGRAGPALLLGSHGAVPCRTLQSVDGLVEADLDRVVARRWAPPVTLGVRLV